MRRTMAFFSGVFFLAITSFAQNKVEVRDLARLEDGTRFLYAGDNAISLPSRGPPHSVPMESQPIVYLVVCHFTNLAAFSSTRPYKFARNATDGYCGNVIFSGSSAVESNDTCPACEPRGSFICNADVDSFALRTACSSRY